MPGPHEVPSVGGMRPRSILALLASLAALAATATPASASTGSDEQRGGALVQALTSGSRACDSFSSDDFELIGEYAMGRMLGSTSAHETMNARMRYMMSAQSEERMHVWMGQRYTRCATGAVPQNLAGMWNMMGDWWDDSSTATAPSQQSGRTSGWCDDYSDDDGWCASRSGAGQQGSANGGASSGSTTTSTPAAYRARTTGGGWAAWQITLLALAAAALGAGAVALLARKPWRRPQGPGPSHALTEEGEGGRS